MGWGEPHGPSAMMVARAELLRRAGELAATAQQYLDCPSAAARAQLREVVDNYREVSTLTADQVVTQIQAEERRRVIRQENTAHGQPAR